MEISNLTGTIRMTGHIARPVDALGIFRTLWLRICAAASAGETLMILPTHPEKIQRQN